MTKRNAEFFYYHLSIDMYVVERFLGGSPISIPGFFCSFVRLSVRPCVPTFKNTHIRPFSGLVWTLTSKAKLPVLGVI